MSAITLTPVDPTTAAVVVNSEILYHVFTINGVTRVFYGKGGKSPYQIDVQETASAIAALCPNLIEVTTVIGAEYLFIGSGGTGPGKGIMFIEADGSGSKITFRYVEESTPILIYSSDSPATLAGRINASSPSSPAQLLSKTVDISAAQAATIWTTPVELIEAPAPGYAIVITSVAWEYNFVSTSYDAVIWYIGPQSSYISGFAPYQVPDSLISAVSSTFCQIPLANTIPLQTIFDGERIILFAGGANPTQGDGNFRIHLVYQIVAV